MVHRTVNNMEHHGAFASSPTPSPQKTKVKPRAAESNKRETKPRAAAKNVHRTPDNMEFSLPPLFLHQKTKVKPRCSGVKNREDKAPRSWKKCTPNAGQHGVFVSFPAARGFFLFFLNSAARGFTLVFWVERETGGSENSMLSGVRCAFFAAARGFVFSLF